MGSGERRGRAGRGHRARRAGPHHHHRHHHNHVHGHHAHHRRHHVGHHAHAGHSMFGLFRRNRRRRARNIANPAGAATVSGGSPPSRLQAGCLPRCVMGVFFGMGGFFFGLMLAIIGAWTHSGMGIAGIVFMAFSMLAFSSAIVVCFVVGMKANNQDGHGEAGDVDHVPETMNAVLPTMTVTTESSSGATTTMYTLSAGMGQPGAGGVAMEASGFPNLVNQPQIPFGQHVPLGQPSVDMLGTPYYPPSPAGMTPYPVGMTPYPVTSADTPSPHVGPVNTPYASSYSAEEPPPPTYNDVMAGQVNGAYSHDAGEHEIPDPDSQHESHL